MAEIVFKYWLPETDEELAALARTAKLVTRLAEGISGTNPTKAYVIGDNFTADISTNDFTAIVGNKNARH